MKQENNCEVEPIKYYSLTHPQKAIWYTEKLYPNTGIGNIAATIRLKGEINYLLLEKAVNLFIEKNDALRLRIIEQDGQPKQCVSEYKYRQLELMDFSQKTIEDLYKWDQELTYESSKLIDTDLFYFILIKISENEGGVYGRLHHLVSDAWTLVQGGSWIVEYYTKLKNGEEITGDKQPSYIDFIQSEKEYEKSDRFQKSKDFWHARFETLPELTALKTRKTDYANTKARRKTFVTPLRLTQKIYDYCEEKRTSVFSLFLSALSLYVNRVTGKDDLVFGTAVLNRSNFKEKNTAGMFISTVPVRIRLDDRMNFNDFNSEVSKEWMALLRHQKYPYDVLLKEVREKHRSTDNLYDISISYQNAKFHKESQLQEYITRWHFNGHQTDSLSIHINDREEEGHLIIDYDYQIDLFCAKEIEFIHQHIINLLWHALDNPSKEVCKLNMLSEKEKHKILYKFNNTYADYPRDKTIHQLFEEQVERTPDNTALVFEDRQMTYRELNEKSNQFARVLRSKGVKPDGIVGIMVHRSFEMIIGILGIIKAGGAYLPIDPEYPEERIKYMLEDSQAGILLTQTGLLDKVGFGGEIVNVEDSRIYEGDKSNLDNVNKPSDLIYVIYTSGSTGKPKGVMIEHRDVVGYVTAFKYEFEVNTGDIMLQHSTYSFDAFVEEVYTTLLIGGRLVIINTSEAKDITKIYDKIIENRINIISCSPLVIKELNNLPKLESVHTYISGGDILKKAYIDKLVYRGKVYNTYGPTETTVCASYYRCIENDLPNVPIGKPISNYKLYILDKNHNVLPIGIMGELYISGVGVGRGYLNKPEQTRDKFIVNPFEPNEKLFRTGDLARWYPKGEVEFLGRLDQQVKVRGFRVELGEIETHLLAYECIKNAVVIDREDKNGRKFICAYIVCDERISISKLKSYLAKTLPSFMIPSCFIKLKEIPLTPNGKVDRKTLPEPKENMIKETEYEKPKNEVERKLVEICREVLSLEEISVTDNFFDIGGDSLNIVSFVIKTKKELNIEIPLNEVYKSSTIRQIANYISANKCNHHDDKLVNKGKILIKESQNDQHFFFIHAGYEEIGAYTELCKNLGDNFTYWGIRANEYLGLSPRNLSMEEVVQDYLSKIKAIQPQGPYHICGWCIGGTLAFEMVRCLELEGEQIRLFALVDAIPPMKWKGLESFTIETEKNFIMEYFPCNKQSVSTKDFYDINDLWEFVIDYYENDSGLEVEIIRLLKARIPKEIIQAIPNYDRISLRQLIYYINSIRTFHNLRAFYRPTNKIRSQVHFFEARNSSVVKNKNKWKLYSCRPIKFYKVNGDHYSIFKSPDVLEFSERLRQIINPKNLLKYIN